MLYMLRLRLNLSSSLRRPHSTVAWRSATAAARLPSRRCATMTARETGPPTAGTGSVFPEQYEEQLQDKISRVRGLFEGQYLPEIEVFRSRPEHFRMRTEFRVWLAGEDLYYVMFEKNEQQGHSAADPADTNSADHVAVASDGEEPDSLAEASSSQPATDQLQEQQSQQQQQQQQQPEPSSPTKQRPKRKKLRRSELKKLKAAAANGQTADAAALAAVYGRRKFNRVRIDEFPVASELICAVMPLLRQELIATPVLRERLFQANFHTTLSKEAMVTLTYHSNLDDVWHEAAKGLRARLLKALGPEQCSQLHIIGRSRKQKVTLDADHVIERMEVAGRTYQYMQVEGAFSQPNGGVCQHMLNWAVDVTKGSSGDLLELYCGNGNFTIPLAQNFKQVVATEVMKASVAAARHNIGVNEVDNIFIARMSSEEFTETWRVKGTRNRLQGLEWDQLNLETLFVDPPRAGLDPDTEKLMQEFRQVVYISCNPETLAKNLKTVTDTHDIVRFAVFDQFPYTHHLECGAFLVKKRQQ